MNGRENRVVVIFIMIGGESFLKIDEKYLFIDLRIIMNFK